MLKLSLEETKIHARAVRFAKVFKQVEWKLVRVLKELETTQLYKKLGYKSLYLYAAEELGLSPSNSYSFGAVARAALEYPQLSEALEDQTLAVPKAARLMSTIDAGNVEHLIAFAKEHSYEDVDKECVRLKPRNPKRDRVKPIAEDAFELRVTLSADTYEKLQRAQSVIAQKDRPFDYNSVLNECLEVFLEKSDPVRRAARAATRNPDILDVSAPEDSVATEKTGRVPFTAAEKQATLLRYEGQCSHMNEKGHRCTSDRWVDVHHIIEVSRGGTNHPSNLCLLCSYHHDLVHKMNYPTDGPPPWLWRPPDETQ